MPFKDPIKAKEYKKIYRKEHREQIKEYNIEYNNRAETKKHYRKNNPLTAKTLKLRFMRDSLSVEEFNKWNKERRKERIKEWNKEYRQRPEVKEMARKRYKKNRTYTEKTPKWVLIRDSLSKEEFNKWTKEKTRLRSNERMRILHKENTIFINNYKTKHPCLECGEKDVRCLEFHHRNPEKKNYAIHKLKKCSLEKIKKEIKKCDVLCKNCHSKLHLDGINDINKIENKIKEIENSYVPGMDPKKRGKLARKKQGYLAKKFAIEYKSTHNCEHCEENHINCLVFHHKDPLMKKGNISKLYNYGIKVIKEEILKCQLLCQNCHAKIHYG